jgi:uncharacterized protein (TIGR00725 family)
MIGGHARNTTVEAMELAEAVGFALGLRGYGIVCGGGDGIMEAACRGNRDAGGVTVGILKFNEAQAANPFVDIAIPTAMDVASNNVIIWAASAVIAFEGRYGTLNEIALALDFEKPLLLVGNAPLLGTSTIPPDRFKHLVDCQRGDAERVVGEMERLISHACTLEPTNL